MFSLCVPHLFSLTEGTRTVAALTTTLAAIDRWVLADGELACDGPTPEDSFHPRASPRDDG